MSTVLATVRARTLGVTVERQGRTVLADADLQLTAGTVHALVGPNGAGKSTLLAALSGDVAPSAGAVELDGRELHRWSHREQARRRTVLLQQASLGLPFTVAEVVRMGRQPWAGTDAAEDDEASVSEAMADTDVTQFGPRRFATLSGGEQARVALARALAQRTDVLLLDEPTAALDLRHQELVMTLARRQAAAGVAVAVVLHDLGLAAAHCDRVTLLADGRVAGSGTVPEVLRADLLSEVYRHPVEVLAHPRTGELLVLPVRR